MSLAMTQDERESFLAGLHVGVLAIPDGERGPLTAPIWYGYEPRGLLTVLIGPSSRKGKLLKEGTRVSLVAQQEAMPYKYVSVEGPVASIVTTEDGEIETMAKRYLGEEMGAAYAAQSTGENVTVSVQIDRWLTVDYGKADLG